MLDLQEKRKWRDSVVWKLFAIGVLVLVLLIPLGMVGSLVSERQQRREVVARELAATWGNSQVLGGPLLSVPYRVTTLDSDGKPVVRTELAHFLPETLRIEGRIVPERRSRGIFEVVLYRADLRVAGAFAPPDFAQWRVAPEDVQWDEATLAFGVTDMRGIRRRVRLAWGGRELAFTPGGARRGLWESGLQATRLGLARETAGRSHPFAFDLAVNGSGTLCFLPAGATTTVALRSRWPDPSFAGAYLPERRTVSERGFAAVWSVPFFGRNYPQSWREAEGPELLQGAAPAAVPGFDRDDTAAVPAVPGFGRGGAAAAFGVELYLPVDAYQKTERSTKYGVLFLLLTFVTFFLYETFHPFAVHPLQYLLVGAALCLFYLLLLSISEHMPFGLAYAIAAAATVGLIAGYSAAVLRGRGRAAVMGAILALLYGYLYVLLQAEDYALLLGAIGLFLILALVMFVTRRIDWYAPRRGGGPPAMEVGPAGAAGPAGTAGTGEMAGTV